MTADNVLGTPALAAGWVYFEGTFAELFRTLTVTRGWIEKSWRKANQSLTPWFALTVKFIGDTQTPYTNWEPYNQTPAIEAPEYKNLEVSSDGLKWSACLSMWTWTRAYTSSRNWVVVCVGSTDNNADASTSFRFDHTGTP